MFFDIMGFCIPIVLGVSEPLQVHVNPMISEPTVPNVRFGSIGTLVFRPGVNVLIVSFIDAIAEAIEKMLIP